LLAGNHCRKLIALSQFAIDNQVSRMPGEKSLIEDILAKTVIMHPPQEAMVEEGQKKNERFTFCFIGHDFFRKGGMEVLECFRQLIPEFPEIRLLIVSGFGYGKWKDFHITPEDVIRVRKIIESFPENIEHHEHVPFAKVKQLIADAHV